MGHSTGCQDAVRLSEKLAKGDVAYSAMISSALKGVVLQAPVRPLSCPSEKPLSFCSLCSFCSLPSKSLTASSPV